MQIGHCARRCASPAFGEAQGRDEWPLARSDLWEAPTRRSHKELACAQGRAANLATAMPVVTWRRGRLYAGSRAANSADSEKQQNSAYTAARYKRT